MTNLETRLEKLINKLKKIPITMDEITSEVEKTRKEKYLGRYKFKIKTKNFKFDRDEIHERK